MGVIMRITFLILLHKFSSGLMKCSPLLSPTLSLDDIVNGAFYLTLAQYSLQARNVHPYKNPIYLQDKSLIYP